MKHKTKGGVDKKIYGWLIANQRGGILTESERLPIFWYRKVAKQVNEEKHFGGDIVKVEIIVVPRRKDSIPPKQNN
jgi:hypothetical protein